jgi:hypothetical protein
MFTKSERMRSEAQAVLGSMNEIIDGNAVSHPGSKETLGVAWCSTPPKGLGWQTHKFSLLDAIETASNLIKTDYAKESEEIITGREGRVIFTTLPHTVLQEANEQGLLPTDRGLVVVGKVTNRKILFDPSMPANEIKLCNSGGRTAVIIIAKAEMAGWFAARGCQPGSF